MIKTSVLAHGVVVIVESESEVRISVEQDNPPIIKYNFPELANRPIDYLTEQIRSDLNKEKDRLSKTYAFDRLPVEQKREIVGEEIRKKSPELSELWDKANGNQQETGASGEPDTSPTD